MTPDSSPEEIEAFMTQMKYLASLFTRDERLKSLLADAKAGNISEEEFLAAVVSAEQKSV